MYVYVFFLSPPLNPYGLLLRALKARVGFPTAVWQMPNLGYMLCARGGYSLPPCHRPLRSPFALSHTFPQLFHTCHHPSDLTSQSCGPYGLAHHRYGISYPIDVGCQSSGFACSGSRQPNDSPWHQPSQESRAPLASSTLPMSASSKE